MDRRLGIQAEEIWKTDWENNMEKLYRGAMSSGRGNDIEMYVYYRIRIG